MLNPHSQQQGGGLTFRDSVNLFYVLVSGHATCVTPFVRRNFGSEALGRNGAVAMLTIVLYMMVYPRHRILVDFGAVWFVMFVLQRVKTGWLLRQGRVLHSRDDGYPWLGFLIPLVKRDKTARVIEFFALFALGTWLSDYDTALGRLVGLSAVSLAIKTGIEEEVFRKRLQGIRDAEIEQRALVERHRRGNF
jgi:hypothetical protein